MKYITIFILLVFSISAYSETTIENFKSSPENRWQFFTDQVIGRRSILILYFLS